LNRHALPLEIMVFLDKPVLDQLREYGVTYQDGYQKWEIKQRQWLQTQQMCDRTKRYEDANGHDQRRQGYDRCCGPALDKRNLACTNKVYD